MRDANTAATADILSDVRNQVACITLNRPKALNALSLDMVRALRTRLQAYASDPDIRAVLIRGSGDKAFCTGGDIRALYQSFKESGSLHREFFLVEYPLDYLLHTYPKPYVALLDGITFGGGMGIAQGSPVRIVGERTRMAMPETAIGFFPDVGGSFFLSRLAGSLGEYVGLTGAHLRAADALYTGLADVYFSPSAAEHLESGLAAIKWSEDARADIDRLIRGMAGDAPTPAPLAALRPAIDLHFAAPSIGELFASLEGENRPEFLDWAHQTLTSLKTRSPTMLVVTLEQLRRGRNMSYAQCLRMEIGMAQRCFAQGDFIEGVRALIIDKDNAPAWRPARIEDVTPTAVAAIFEDPWAGSTHPLSGMEGDFSNAR